MSMNKYCVKSQYRNTGRAELLGFEAELKSLLTTHPNKLHTILFKNELHPAVARRIDRELDADKIVDKKPRADRKAQIEVEFQEEAFAILYQNVVAPELLSTLRRNYDEDGFQAWRYIAGIHSLEDNDTRITGAADMRKEHVEEGLTGAQLDTVKTWTHRLEELNSELTGTPYEMPPALCTTTLLDALAVHIPETVQTFKTRKGRGDWRRDFDAVRDELYELLEENDRTMAKSAAATKRKALRTTSATTDSDLASQLAETQKQLAAVTAKLDALAPDRTRNVMRTTSAQWPKCDHCDRPHATTHGCIGKRILDGELTVEQAADFWRFEDKERRLTAARSAKHAAEQVAAKKKKVTFNTPAQPDIKPTKKVLNMCTRVIRANLSAPTEAAADPLKLLPTGFQRLGMDSKCDQHIFTDAAYFPFGTREPECTILIQTVEGKPTIKAKGVGTAVVITRDGAAIHFDDSLYVPDALCMEPIFAGLASVEQAFRSKAEVRFGAHRDIVFHAADDAIVPLDAGYDLLVRPAYSGEIESEEPHAQDDPTTREDTAEPRAARDPVTRGRGGGGTATLSDADTARLWSFRMPGLSAARLQQLPDITADAPSKLKHATAEHITDDATLMANAPKIHAPPVQRRSTSHRGELTMTDLVGPLAPSKFYGNRYAAPYIDLHQGTTDVAFLPSKDRFPQATRSYVVRNQGKHGCDFRGGTLYRDNEPVLNSAKVDAVLGEFDMTSKNSAEYEPWTNPAERTMRTLQEPMRVMMSRGHAGEEYWEFAMHQAACIANDSHHKWGREDDGKTPSERRTGHPPSIAGRYRPMFCKAFVPVPSPYRTGKTDHRAEMCIHLGLNPKGPGWRFEVIEGPRKGRLVVSTQAVFREFQFPLAPTPADEALPSTTELSTLYPDDDDDDVTGMGGRRAPVDHRATDRSAEDDRDDEQDTRSGDDNTDAAADGTDERDEEDSGTAEQTQPPARRSQRLASSDTLPQTTVAYQKFPGVLRTQAQTVSAFSTRVDMSDSVEPTALLLEASSVPAPATHDAQKLPKTFDQITAIPDEEERGRRLQAYYKEWDGLMAARSGLRVVPKPTGPHKTLKLKEIPSTKKDGTAKLRVVARGDLLEQGIDYDRTFSPTVKHATLRMATAIAAKRDQNISGADVTQAYIRADWPTDEPKMYASRFPDGYESTTPEGMPLALEIGNLYGKPTAGRKWYNKASQSLIDGLPSQDMLDEHAATIAEKIAAEGSEHAETTLTEKMCFRRSEYDWSYFWRWEGDYLMQVILYVDDILIFVDQGTDMRERFMQRFAAVFPTTDFGEEIGAHNNEYLSIRIRRPEPYVVTLDVERYVTDICAQFFPGGVHAAYTVPARLELVGLVDGAVRRKEETLAKINPDMHSRYRSIVGALLFIAITTRPDVQYAAGMLSRCVAYPTAELLKEAERALIYLYATRALQLTYRGDRVQKDGSFAPTIGPLLDDGSSDASFEVGRSTSGYVWRMAGAAVSWGMKKQQSRALFSTEAEIMAGSLAVCDALFLRDSCIERGFPHDAPSILYMDNKGAIDLSHDPVLHASTKHIKRRELYIRDLVLDGTIKPKYVKTVDNMADIFTKPLQRQSFQKHRAALLGI